MFLRMIRKSFLISLLIFPQYFTSAKSSAYYEFKSNEISNEFLISGWKPLPEKNIKNKKASDKTIKTLNKFKKNILFKTLF